MKDLTPNVTTGPLPASRRVWHAGDRHPEIRVPMREIDLHPTAGEPPVTVYDSSGPYTDPDAEIAIDRGLEITVPSFVTRSEVRGAGLPSLLPPATWSC